MKNRGPDFSDYYENKFKKNYVYLLHSRLSIIDLNKRSNQPFRINDYSIILMAKFIIIESLKNSS